MMQTQRAKRLLATLAFVVCSGVGLHAVASNCQFAYDFCWPIYNACLAGGGYPPECHAMLDQCILDNGCSTLP